MSGWIDLRSDTVTQPSEPMRAAMARADVGDDVYGDDPTVNRLQERAAEMFGLEAALFFPSGTQSNLAALISHCQRGEGVIIGAEQHSYRYEAGGLGVLGSIHPQVIPNRPDGTLDLATVEATISPDDPHFVRTRLLALENTIGGKPIARAYLAEAAALARRRGLAIHLDGARIFNAAVHFKTTVKELCAGFDSVSSCLSKGLGAPAGTVLLGHQEFIGRAKRARKILGGAMRQSGVLAAAGLYALEHHVERLSIDHANAARLADGLRSLDLPVEQHTNMAFVTVPAQQVAALVEHLKKRDVAVLAGARLRLVTHLDVDQAGIDRAITAFEEFFAQSSAGARRAAR
jgi:threonine aldolase